MIFSELVRRKLGTFERLASVFLPSVDVENIQVSKRRHICSDQQKCVPVDLSALLLSGVLSCKYPAA